MKSFIFMFSMLIITQIHAIPLRHKRAFSYIANETACTVDNIVYKDGDPIPTDDPCESCKCRPPGFSCVLRECEVKIGCKAIRRVGECCPEYQCGCEHNGHYYNDGDRIPNAESPCYSCYCQGSSITCSLADCKFRFDCEPEYVQGECCPKYDHCLPEPGSVHTTPAKPITTTITTTITKPIEKPIDSNTSITPYELPLTKTTQFPSTYVTTEITPKDKEIITHNVSTPKIQDTTPSVIDKLSVTTIGHERETTTESSIIGGKHVKVKDNTTTVKDNIEHTTLPQLTDPKHSPTVASIEKETKVTTPFTKSNEEISSSKEMVSTSAYGLSTDKHEIITDNGTFKPFNRVTESSSTIAETIKDVEPSVESTTKLMDTTETSEAPQKQSSDLLTIEDIDRPVTEVSPTHKERYSTTVPEHQHDSSTYTHTTLMPDNSKTTAQRFDDTTIKAHISSVKISENVSIATSPKPEITDTFTEKDTKLPTELTDAKTTIKEEVLTDIHELILDSVSQSTTVASLSEITEVITTVSPDDERLKLKPIIDNVPMNETEIPPEDKIYDRSTTVGDTKIATESTITDKKDFETATEYTDKESQFIKTLSFTSESKRPETTHIPTEATVERDTKFSSPHTDSFEVKVTTQKIDSTDLHGHDNQRITESDCIKTTESSVITEKFAPNVTSKHEVTTQSVTDVHELSTEKQEKETDVPLDITTVHSLTFLKDISEITKSPLISSERPEIRQSPTEATIEKDTTDSIKDIITTQRILLTDVHETTEKNETKTEKGTFTPLLDTVTKLFVTVSDLFTEKSTSVPEVTQPSIELNDNPLYR